MITPLKLAHKTCFYDYRCQNNVKHRIITQRDLNLTLRKAFTVSIILVGKKTLISWTIFSFYSRFLSGYHIFSSRNKTLAIWRVLCYNELNLILLFLLIYGFSICLLFILLMLGSFLTEGGNIQAEIDSDGFANLVTVKIK